MNKKTRKRALAHPTKQEIEDFNLGSLMTFQREQRRIDRFNKLIFISLILLIIILASAFAVSIYNYKDRFVVITDKTYYQVPEKTLLAEVFAKNYALNLLEFGLHNVDRKIKNAYRLSITRSKAREKIQQLLHEKYAEKTKTIGLTRIFKINEKKGKQEILTTYKDGIYSTLIKGIQNNINSEGINQLEIELTIESIEVFPTEKSPEIFKVQNFNIKTYIKDE